MMNHAPHAAGSTRKSLLSVLLLTLRAASALLFSSTSAIGVNFGQQSASLPQNNIVLQLIQSTTINSVKIYNADAGVLTIFAGSAIPKVIYADNTEIQPMAISSGYALTWAQDNIAAYPNTNIVGVALGNEVLKFQPQLTSFLLPGLQNLQAALVSSGLDQKVKISTPHSLAVLGISFPPSSGQFSDTDTISPILNFLAQTGSPFMVNVYPYYAYVGNPSSISLDYVLGNHTAAPVTDSGSGLTYYDMFDAEVDAVYAAMSKLGYPNVNIAVSETGWTSAGDPK